MTSANARRDAFAELSTFFPAAGVTDDTIDAYAARARGFRVERVRDVVEKWIDGQDHWPAWSEVRALLHHASRVPGSLAEQGGKSELHRRTEEKLLADFEAKTA